MNRRKKLELCIFIPCHNEAKNLPLLIKKIVQQKLNNYMVILVNDISTDGTDEIADQLAARYKEVKVIHRRPPKGRGRAGKTGWLACLKYKPNYIMEMDADHSHDPAHIPEFLEAVKRHKADVVIGSRYTHGGREVRGMVRKLISLFAEKYLRVVLGVPGLSDPSSGFRLFTKKAVRTFDPKTLESPDHRITTEILFRVRKLKIVEIPIVFHDRRYGQTKLRWPVLIKSFISPLVWRLETLVKS